VPHEHVAADVYVVAVGEVDDRVGVAEVVGVPQRPERAHLQGVLRGDRVELVADGPPVARVGAERVGIDRSADPEVAVVGRLAERRFVWHRTKGGNRDNKTLRK